MFSKFLLKKKVHVENNVYKKKTHTMPKVLDFYDIGMKKSFSSCVYDIVLKKGQKYTLKIAKAKSIRKNKDGNHYYCSRIIERVLNKDWVDTK